MICVQYERLQAFNISHHIIALIQPVGSDSALRQVNITWRHYSACGLIRNYRPATYGSPLTLGLRRPLRLYSSLSNLWSADPKSTAMSFAVQPGLGRSAFLRFNARSLLTRTSPSSHCVYLPFSTPFSSSVRHSTRRRDQGHHDHPGSVIISPTKPQFWTSGSTWRRASINTFRCLIGCTLGDFTTLWFLQLHYPDLGMGTTMALSSECYYLHFTKRMY